MCQSFSFICLFPYNLTTTQAKSNYIFVVFFESQILKQKLKYISRRKCVDNESQTWRIVVWFRFIERLGHWQWKVLHLDVYSLLLWRHLFSLPLCYCVFPVCFGVYVVLRYSGQKNVNPVDRYFLIKCTGNEIHAICLG